MYFVPNEVFYARFDKKKKKVSTFYEKREYVPKKEETPLPDGYTYVQNVAYINAETHDVAIRQEIFVERNK